MPNPLIVSLVYAAIGLVLVFFGRRAYSYPTETLERWYLEVPVKNWSRKLLRVFAVVWVFGGTLVVLSGVVPYVQRFRGISVDAVFVGLAMAGTFLFLRTPKRGPAKSRDNSEFNYIRARLLASLAGTVFLAVGLVGKAPIGLLAPLWMRVTDVAIGLFCFYAALISFPKHRKMGEELRKELDEAEREISSRK